MLKLAGSAIVFTIGLVLLFASKTAIRPSKRDDPQRLRFPSPTNVGRKLGKRRRLELRLDPKTVVQKSQGNRLESLRFVAFGTSRTWGTDVPDPQTQAFIKLLSPSAVNWGIRATQADYPSICLHSMIKDQIFDVVMVEFFPLPHYLPDFVRLLQRLRARFPFAVIIYLNLHIMLYTVHYKGKPVREYLQEKGLKTPYGAAFEQLVSSLPESDFTYNGIGAGMFDVNAVAAYEDAVKAVGGYVLDFPKFRTNAKEFLLEGSKYYGNEGRPYDDVHLSVLGHQEVANHVRRLLSDIALPFPLNGTETGSWAAGNEDICLSWFSNGNFSFQQVSYINMTLAAFSPGQQKYALEVSRDGGEISVNCPFRPCQVFLNHMIYGLEHNYPRVYLDLNGKQTSVNPMSYFIQHTNQILYVGTVHNWNDTITIKVTPLQEDRNRSFPFRITGIATTPILPTATGQ